ncbi:MAG TPA: hypothetical protein VMW01_07460 [Williamwhitmania sp.]|nr:hypothetical protein [Williamwhitmania sp.]
MDAKEKEKFKLSIPKRDLLFVAAGVWTFAGGMLLVRGGIMLMHYPAHLWIKELSCLVGGLLFYWVLFSTISQKHTTRILTMDTERPCMFAFFSVRSYLLMVVMISLGITLRLSGIISPEYLSYGYLTMGIPLFLSAFRFYYVGIRYQEVISEKNGENYLD